MKTSVTVAFAALAASVSAFHGQVSFHYSTPGEGTFSYLFLRDYDTGCTYTTQ